MHTQYKNLKVEDHMGHTTVVEDNIKMDPKIMAREDVNLIYLAQNRVHLWGFVNAVMNRRVP